MKKRNKTAAKKQLTSVVVRETAGQPALVPDEGLVAARRTGRRTSVVVQYGGQEVSVDAVRERAEADLAANGSQPDDVTQMDIYIKPEEGMAYYVASGEESQITGKISL